MAFGPASGILRSTMRIVDVKKPPPTFFPPTDVRRFRRAVNRWLRIVSNQDAAGWAKHTVQNEGVISALLELTCWYKIAPEDLLGFLEELRLIHVPQRELRALTRKLARTWKEVELLSNKARDASKPYLGELAESALAVENTARLLSRFFSTPRAKRPVEMEIAQCKADIESFLRRRRVREINQYGWILLKAVFGNLWSAGSGKDQTEAYRQIPSPSKGKILTRADAENAIEKAKVDVLRMEHAVRKG